jgi:ankyrin repeat protein
VAWIDAQRRDLRSALHVAVQHQQHSWPLTLMLVEAGANTNLVDWEGCTALHYAQSADVAALLLRRGARDAACQRGFTALMKACERGDAALTSLLLSYGSDVDAMAYDGVSSPLSITAANGALDVLCVLLDATPPPDVNLRSIAGQTPLFDAVANKQPQAVDLLLDAGADPSAADDNGASPLMLVADPESLGYLVAAAPQAVAQRDRRGRTVLAHLCADPGSSGVLKALFLVCDSHGVKVDVDAADEQGETALHVAVAGLNVEAVRVLLGRRAQVSGSCRSVGAAQECLDLMLQQLAGDEQPEAKRRRYRRTFLSNRRH